ncbi:SusC/RagA family TonB-linked outer membrane protein [Parabacteroides sp. FAFU027]|uniref:SusC/RagA family TonB-linked outer membrane protein n=1 Tax=Parabacteroides sp. FAFU027 TaxID=2922715 RepID=UPI001FAEFB55|nr:TonB-dependent receptor [Parabacteroides sp. FAFU027]
MRKILCSLLLTILSVCYAYAQTTVTGVVKDDTGESLPGATVSIKGTTTGTITDINGKFSLKVQNPANTILKISYVGMKDQELPLKGRATTGIQVKLQASSHQLQEVVAIGYGTMKKRDLTGSVTSLQGSTIASVPVTGTAEAMTGRLAGVQVTTADGSPDAEILVRVRGGGSITQSNSPLYIVDGFPAENINSISPADIQSIDVLKDASSTAIYGSRGANGVVIITTKTAKGGKTQISYNGFMQTKRLSKRMSVLDPYEYVKLNYELAALNGTDGISSFEKKFGVYDDLDLYKYQKGHDWQDDMFGSNIVSQQHNISITGGSEKTKFSLSSTYNKDGGLMQNNNYTRYTNNFKLIHEISDKLSLNINARLADIKVNGSGSSGGTYKIRTSQAVTSAAVNGLSDQVEVDPATMSDEEYQQWIESHMSLTEQAQQYWKQKNDRTFNFLGSLDWKIIKRLTFRTEGGYEYGFKDEKNYWGERTTNASYVDGKPLVDWTKTTSARYRWANTLTYNTKFQQDHSLTAMAGTELNNYDSNYNYLYATGFGTDLSPETIFANLGLGGNTKNLSSYFAEPIRSFSYFGRINYGFKDKYLFAATFRADQTSRFEPGHQWGYFPAVSGAWRINQEEFMANTKDWLSNLKLKVGYGVAGNSNVPTGLTSTLYSIASTKTYGLGDIQNNYWATASSQLPNPKLGWETNYTENVGLDFGLFNERISGTVEVYSNTAKDLLLTIPIVAPGYTQTTMNIGQTSNKGLEVSLNAGIIKSKRFNLNSNFNIAFNKSNVDKLANGVNVQEYASGWAGTDLKGYYDYHVEVGQPVGLIYGWVSDGYYKTSDFESYNASTGKYVLKSGVPTCGMLGGVIGTRPGTAKYKDLNGDGVVDDKDRTIIGKTSPKFNGGFGFNGNYRDFDFSVLFSYVYGNQIYNANKIASSQQYRTSNPNLLGFMNQSNRYTYLDNATGKIVTDLATLAEMNEGANAKQYWSPFSFGNATVLPSSWAIEDGSFLRLQNVTVGYTVPKILSKKFLCDQLRVYATVNNVFVLTNYTGYDPEVSTPVRGSSTSSVTPGVDYSSYPKSFSWTFGVNLSF